VFARKKLYCGGNFRARTSGSGKLSTVQSLLDESLDDTRLGESGDITELIVFVGGDLA
jgi:hypothetical protein